MPTIDKRARSGRDRWRGGMERPATIVIALTLFIGACTPIKNSAPPPAAAGPSPPIAVERLPGPIALAPSITGAPAPAPRPVAAVATSTPPTAPTAAVGGAPSPCPPGAIAMWSKPDVTGTPVAICRSLSPPQ